MTELLIVRPIVTTADAGSIRLQRIRVKRPGDVHVVARLQESSGFLIALAALAGLAGICAIAFSAVATQDRLVCEF